MLEVEGEDKAIQLVDQDGVVVVEGRIEVHVEHELAIRRHIFEMAVIETTDWKPEVSNIKRHWGDNDPVINREIVPRLRKRGCFVVRKWEAVHRNHHSHRGTRRDCGNGRFGDGGSGSGYPCPRKPPEIVVETLARLL